MLVSILKIRSGHGSLNHKTGIHDVGCMKWLKPEGPLFSDDSYVACDVIGTFSHVNRPLFFKKVKSNISLSGFVTLFVVSMFTNS